MNYEKLKTTTSSADLPRTGGCISPCHLHEHVFSFIILMHFFLLSLFYLYVIHFIALVLMWLMLLNSPFCQKTVQMSLCSVIPPVNRH